MMNDLRDGNTRPYPSSLKDQAAMVDLYLRLGPSTSRERLQRLWWAVNLDHRCLESGLLALQQVALVQRNAHLIPPPDKPPPSASKKRPLSRRKISEPVRFRKGRHATVTVQLVFTHSIKVDVAASTQDLVRAAVSTF